MKLGIIGAGLIGKKRALSAISSGDKVICIADINFERAKKLSNEFPGSKPTSNYIEIINNKDVDAVVIATTHNNLAKITLEALKNKKHVLAEKPLGIKSLEVSKCVSLADKNNLIYMGGFNHRFHPGIFKAKQLIDKGRIGKIMYMNAQYGHGGRPGYEKEWRMDKKISGGGELIDQGAHLIDLALWFYGKVPQSCSGSTITAFWPVKVEDNAFITLKDKKFIANLHASWTEWKNRFVFEIYGDKGYIKINGLGGSYGKETLTMGTRVPGMAPEEKIWSYDGDDISWKKQWQNFKISIKDKSKMIGSGKEGLRVLKIAETIYNKRK